MKSRAHMPAEELAWRHAQCRSLLQSLAPEAGGLLVFSRINIYYLSGTLGNGILWLPREGEPVLMVRKGQERCLLESPLKQVLTFKSYSSVPEICAAAGSPLTEVVAAEMYGLPWSLADMLQSRLRGTRCIPGDAVLRRARALKTAWELDLLRQAGQRHIHALHELLPLQIHSGMSERDIAHTLWDIFFGLGHHGMLRVEAPGQEMFLGRVAAGSNGNYPSPFGGPLGLMGEHAALPFMGYAGSTWRKGQLLSVDSGFVHAGYHTDMAITYWAGGPEAIPDVVYRAQECCESIIRESQYLLTPGQSVSTLWHAAQAKAEAHNFSFEFMGIGNNKTSFLGQGVGLSMDEWPIIGEDETILEEGMVLSVGPRIGLAQLGMVGTRQVFVVQPKGGLCLTGNDAQVRCVEE